MLQRQSSLRATVQGVIAEGNYVSVSRESLREALETSGALGLAQERAIEYATAARSALDGLRDTPQTEALRSISDYIVERDR